MAPLRFLGLALFALLSASAQAVPLSFTFRIDGFGDSGYVTGSFTGEDLNNDGLIRTFWNSPLPYELKSYSVSYHGDPAASLFSHNGITSLGASFIFNLTTYSLTFGFETNPIGPTAGFTQSQVSYVLPGRTNTGVTIRTTQAPVVTAVPEGGSSFFLLLLGLVVPLLSYSRSSRPC